MKTFTLLLGFLVHYTAAQRRPPNYSQDDMPETNFNCRDKILGGYYADPETDCQMFHVCVKVPGVGVQDYRFLCPNDTSFDQENQICANWFDIDCEAATLYYSDNFDLYRIGYNPSSRSVDSTKTSPIPLGPSSVRPPVKAPAVSKPRPHYQYVRPSDEEEDYYLQRSETGDGRLQQDLLRGSSSSNFFNNNKDKDDDDDNEDETYRDLKDDQSYRRPSSGNKKKVAVRKLVRRPNNNFAQEGENYPTQKPTSVPSTQNSRGSNPDNYNYNNEGNGFRNQQQQNYNVRNYQKPVPFTASNNYTPTTESAIADNNDRTPGTSSTYHQPRYNTIQRNGAQSSTTTQPPVPNNVVSSNYNHQKQSENNANTQENNYNTANYYNTFSAQKSTEPKLIQYSTTETTASYFNNYQQQRGTNSEKYNNKNNGPNTDIYSTTANYPLSSKSNHNDNAQESKATNDYAKNTATNFSPTTFAPYISDAYSSGNNQKRFGNSYNQRSTDYSNTKSTVGFISTTLSPAANTQTYKDYERKTSEDYNNFNNYDYQRTNNNFGRNSAVTGDFAAADDNKDGEFLKTAPSNNYRPNSFNTFQNYNANSKTNTPVVNNYTSTTATNSKSSQNYSSDYYVIPKTVSYTSTETNYLGKQSSNSNNNYYSETTAVPPRPFSIAATNPVTRKPQITASQNYPTETIALPSSKEPTSTVNYQEQRNSNYNAYSVSSTTAHTSEYDNIAANSGTKKTPISGSKTHDASYDYAYYDDSNTEYDGLDPLSGHHFGKGGESLKVARSTISNKST